MKVILLLISIFIVGCASTDNNQNAENQNGDITNSDFQKKPLIPFNSSTDQFNLEESSLLSSESIYRLDEDGISDNDLGGIPLSDIISLCYQRKYDRAFSLIDNYYVTYKKHANYWNQVGSCYFLKGDYRKAILFYNQALDLNKKYAPPLNNLGVMFIRQKKYQQAREYLKRAAKYSPRSRTPIFNLAHLYLQFGLVDRAKRLFTVLHNKDSNDVDVMSGLGSSYLMSGEANSALEYYKQIDDKYLWRPDISLNYAMALRKIGNKSDAIDVFEKIKKSKIGRYQTYYNKVGKFLRR